MAQEQITAALNLMRRMPPSQIEQSLSGLVNLVPDITEELLQRVDQPLKVAKDEASGRFYLLCDYNRDGDSYRSPWSNKYDPPVDDGFVPSAKLRNMEVLANEVFDVFRDQYYDGGVSSVYFWDMDDNSFAACFLIRKDVSESRGVSSGSWDSIHVFDVREADGFAHYKLTTTIMVSMQIKELGNIDLSGNLTRQAENSVKLDEEKHHIANMGEMLEKMENNMRNSLDLIYIQKTREVINGMRKTVIWQSPVDQASFVASLNESILKKGATRQVDSET